MAGPGRPQKPVDPAAGEVAQFARGLRDLKAAEGMSYRKMAALAHYSSTALSTAANGDRLPSWDVTKAYVTVCRGDIQEWHQRWSAVRATLTDDEPTPQMRTLTSRDTMASENKVTRNPAWRRSVVITSVVLLFVMVTAYLAYNKKLDEPVTQWKDPSEQVMALGDLPPVVGNWTAGGMPADLGGQDYPQTLRQTVDSCTQRRAAVEYNLGKRFTRLVAFAGIDDNSPNATTKASIMFQGDGRTIAISQLTFGTRAQRLDVDVSDVLRLTIIVSSEGTDPTCKPMGIDLAQATLFPTPAPSVIPTITSPSQEPSG
ncbi:hypothetical protein BS329_40280 [Amycolatopsis coloradensis]|uniref:Glycosyl hydrolase family 98 putative carbohydrate-binding module domain-containing protein n=1 Tax=Amycolatopsis coloradensis TaxID=76021 RepID=A0A1R0KDV8_9PSEU|nr:NPCBM/NEW2 domain-containing protein [Amycolatopsis coloradensis]OLZ43173.1 hypothetical protein BS329_40280 [Amycolatopsis coloradensis]